MNTFRELLSESKYKNLDAIIKKMISKKMISVKDSKSLFNDVVDEYLDMGDNPDEASTQDVYEIADAGGYGIVED
jgi:hypothetical protein